MGKGSARRKEDTDKIRSNWDAIFKKEQQTVEEPQQDEPIGWIAQNAVGDYYFRLKKPDDVYKPFLVFKPKQWIGLTEEDKQISFDDTQEGGSFWDFAEAIEATLRRKNEFR